MINPIDKASAIANGTFNEATSQINATANAELDNLEKSTEDLLNSLPTIPDPELVYRQKEAEVLEKLAELEKRKLELQELGIDDVKQQIRDLILPTIPIPPKIPLISRKVLLAVILAKREKLLADLKKLKSKNNLKKGKKLFSYPLTPPRTLSLPNVPSIPSIPKIPSIDSLPTLPNVPTISD